MWRRMRNMKELKSHFYEGKSWVIYEDRNKMHGKENRFLTKTDAENTIRTIVKQNPKIYKFAEK